MKESLVGTINSPCHLREKISIVFLCDGRERFNKSKRVREREEQSSYSSYQLHSLVAIGGVRFFEFKWCCFCSCLAHTQFCMSLYNCCPCVPCFVFSFEISGVARTKKFSFIHRILLFLLVPIRSIFSTAHYMSTS